MSIAEARLELELAHRAIAQMTEASSFEGFGAAMRTFVGVARAVRSLVTQVASGGDGDRIERKRFASWLVEAMRTIDAPLPLGELHLGHDLTIAYTPGRALVTSRPARRIGRPRREPRRGGAASFAARAVYFVHDRSRPALELCVDHLLRLGSLVEDAASQAAVLDAP